VLDWFECDRGNLDRLSLSIMVVTPVGNYWSIWIDLVRIFSQRDPSGSTLESIDVNSAEPLIPIQNLSEKIGIIARSFLALDR
jgi:hypothetical protein